MKFLLLFVLLIMTIGFSSCSRVESGYVGIKVYMLGGNKGVDTEVLGVGKYWIGINEQLYVFPTYQQNYVWTKDATEGSPNDESISFQTKEGLAVNADFGISYAIDPTKAALIFQKYRKGVEEITDIFLRNSVRDAINSESSSMSVEDVYGPKKTELIANVIKRVRAEMTPIGIIVDKIYLIGNMRLPEQVIAALNAKIEATQTAMKIQNEVASARAQAEKAVAIAKGEAEANRIKMQSITPALIEYERVQKWNGVMPQVVGSANTMFNLK